MRNSKKLIRVLLADDHAVVRAGIRQFLEESDLISVVAEASDGLEACDRLEQLTVDVAVLDIQMPGRSGIEVVRWMRTHTPQTGALVLTAYDDEPYVQAVLGAGAGGYVLKTARPEEIVAAVQAVYEGHLILDAQLTRRTELQGAAGELDQVHRQRPAVPSAWLIERLKSSALHRQPAPRRQFLPGGQF